MTSLIDERLGTRRRIYLLRHAEVSYFGDDGAPLDTRDLPLSARGREQARQLALVLADAPIDRVVTSGLSRTRETAELVLGARDLRIEDHAGLEEIRPGHMREWAPRFASAPQELERFFIESLSRRIEPQQTFLDGEAFGSFQERVEPAFTALIDETGWRHLLLVAHGGTNRVVLTRALGGTLQTLGAIEQDPCCLNIIDVDADGHTLVRLSNYTEYSPHKRDIHMTTMEEIYSRGRGTIAAMAARAGKAPGDP